LGCLKEINRVLRPGGILRIATPDLDHWIATYDPGDPDTFLRRIFEPEISGDINRIHWMYTPQSLGKILQEAGFNNITPHDRFQGKCPDVQRIDYRSDVMFIEGEK
jgi:SAM-dependent methyltransferase